MSILDQSSQALGSVLDPIAAAIKNPFGLLSKVGLGAERGPDFPQGFVIVEYVDGVPQDGSGGRPDTHIQLVGNMMPMQPFTFDGEQRLIKDFYPGNPEPAVHVMGSREGDLTIHGRFKDKRFKESGYYGVSYQFSIALDAMRKRGNLLRFGMHGSAGRWIRYGFLEKVSFKMNKLSYIDYEITFFVVGETQPKNNYFATREKIAPTSVNQNLLNAASDFNESYSSVPNSMPQTLAGAMNDIISGVASNIKKVTGFVDGVLTTISDIQASANRAIGLIKNARASISKYRRQIGNIAHGFSSLSGSGNAVGQFKDTYRNVSYLHNTIAGTHAISAYLAQLQKQFEAIAQTIPIARYKVTQGDTLQKISTKFYSTSDNWKLIYDHNKLQSTVLTPGKILEIPRA